MTLRKSPSGRQIENQLQRLRCKASRLAGLILLALLCAAGACTQARAEALNARISVVSVAPARIKIEGERSTPARTWSFRNTYAGIIGLAERIENLSLTDEKGDAVALRKLAPGEYEAAAPALRFSYEVRLDPPTFESDAAHASWLAGGHGFLMLGDLLPLAAGGVEQRATLHFKLPERWAVAASMGENGAGKFEVTDAESAVFFVGQNLRQRRRRVGATEFSLVTTGEWAFSDDEVAGVAAGIIEDHAATFGGDSRRNATLMLAPFPRQAGAGRWSAETRGDTVLLLSGRSPSKTAALSQLSFPLAHELFHLWVPNGLKLDGSYDWFYEGFTLYQALRAGVRRELLTFEDYLGALGRAFDAYKAARDRDKLSLLEASKQRWAGSPALVYNKGMLVAFLYDLTLRQLTRGRRSLDDVYRELFRLYSAPESRRDANEAVLAVLNAQGEMQDFTRRYVEGAGTVDLAAALAPFGLQVEQGGARTHITVNAKVAGAQRDLLRKFGYNEKTYGVIRHGNARP